jgi:hypothetical protein
MSFVSDMRGTQDGRLLSAFARKLAEVSPEMFLRFEAEALPRATALKYVGPRVQPLRVERPDGTVLWKRGDPVPQIRTNPRRLAMRRNTAHAASGLTDEKMLRLACVGMCGEFAVALQNVYGYPLGAFYEVGSDGYDEGDFTLLHAFAYHPSKKVVDSAGIRAKKDVRADLLVMSGGKIEEHPTTAGDIDALSMSGLDADVLAHAEDYVRARPEVYGPSRANPAKKQTISSKPLTAEEKEKLGRANVFLMDWVCDGYGDLPPRIAEIEALQRAPTNVEARELLAWFDRNASGENFSGYR